MTDLSPSPHYHHHAIISPPLFFFILACFTLGTLFMRFPFGVDLEDTLWPTAVLLGSALLWSH